MKINEELVKLGLIPLSKYWSIRMCFLDIINGTLIFIPLIENFEGLGDDVKRAIEISKEWSSKNEHNVGESGTLLRFLQFASWKFGFGKKFIKEGTLKDRSVCDNLEIVNWKIGELLNLDNGTTQWASAAILCGYNREIPEDFFLDMSLSALKEYKLCKEEGLNCDIKYDGTILKQANTFVEILNGEKTKFIPEQPDDYCFARAFGFISKEEGENEWPQLKGHESNRLDEMETMLRKFEEGETIDSRDHRVVQAIALLSIWKGKNIEIQNKGCVSKSWPQFWDFFNYAKNF